MSALECLRLAVGGILTLSVLLREALPSQVAEHQSSEVQSLLEYAFVVKRHRSCCPDVETSRARRMYDVSSAGVPLLRQACALAGSPLSRLRFENLSEFWGRKVVWVAGLSLDLVWT